MTSGPSRRVHLRTGDVTLLHTTPSRMELAGSPAGEALSALLYLGKHEVTPEIVERVRAALSDEEFSRPAVMPSWLSDSLHMAAESREALSA